MINIYSKIFVAGHKGMVGSSILRILKKKGYKNLITIDKKRLDLRDQKSVKEFLKRKKPQAVIIAAGKVGGIRANINYPANFMNDNLQIQTNLISASYENKVKKLIKDAMVSVSSSEHHMFSIPLEVSINSGNNWGEAH